MIIRPYLVLPLIDITMKAEVYKKELSNVQVHEISLFFGWSLMPMFVTAPQGMRCH